MPKPIKINRRLHLTIPLYDGDDQVYAWAHSAPISHEVFEAHFKLLSLTFTAIFADGLGIVGGPRVAMMTMRDVAARRGMSEQAESLTNEMRRLTNALVRRPDGWEHLPWHDACQTDIDDDDARAAENAIAFFTAVSAMQHRRDAAEIMSGAAGLWGASTTYSDFTAFRSSLQTSKPAASTGATPAPGSQVPF